MTNNDLKNKLSLMNNMTSIKELQEYLCDMVKVRGWENETIQELMIFLTEEMGELARGVRKISNLPTDANKIYNYDIGSEIADVFCYLLAICRVLNINLLEEFIKKEKKNCDRVWQ